MSRRSDSANDGGSDSPPPDSPPTPAEANPSVNPAGDDGGTNGGDTDSEAWPNADVPLDVVGIVFSKPLTKSELLVDGVLANTKFYERKLDVLGRVIEVKETLQTGSNPVKVLSTKTIEYDGDSARVLKQDEDYGANGSFEKTFKYDASGRTVEKIQLQNGKTTRTTWEYDDAKKTVDQKHFDADGTVDAEIVFDFKTNTSVGTSKAGSSPTNYAFLGLNSDPDNPIFTAGSIGKGSFQNGPNGSFVSDSSGNLKASCSYDKAKHLFTCDFETTTVKGSSSFVVAREKSAAGGFAFKVLETAFSNQKKDAQGEFYQSQTIALTYNKAWGMTLGSGSIRSQPNGAAVPFENKCTLATDDVSPLECLRDHKYLTRNTY